MFRISRRDLVLSAAGATAMFGLSKPIAFVGDAHALHAQTFKKFMIGDIEVFSLSDGIWEKAHDENFIKGVSVEQTKAALRAAGQPDEMVIVPFTPIAVRTGGNLVLLDTGSGGGQTGGPKAGVLAKSMADAGLDPKSVRTILISHFHADHTSGLMARETNAEQFPEAEIVVSQTEFDFWTKQPVDSFPQARRAQAQRMQATLGTWKNVRPVSGEVEVARGIRTVPAFGHTQGHTAFLISNGGQQLLHTVDATNNFALNLRNPDWQIVFDHVPDQAVETRKRLFDRAIADKAMVAGYHWGVPNIGTIAKDGNGYAFTRG